MQGINNGGHLAQAIDECRTWATCSSPSIERKLFGMDTSRVGEERTVDGSDCMSGIPRRFMLQTGTLTGRYVIPQGCKRMAARWEVRLPSERYVWVEMVESGDTG